MEEEKIFLKNCQDDQVLSWPQTNLKVNQFKERLKKIFSNENHALRNLMSQLQIPEVNYQQLEDWLGQGISCETLKPGAKGWQKGKVKININVTIEFIPDEPEIAEPESPLDDFRSGKF